MLEGWASAKALMLVLLYIMVLQFFLYSFVMSPGASLQPTEPVSEIIRSFAGLPRQRSKEAEVSPPVFSRGNVFGYVTLCTDDKFLDLALVMAHSLKKSGTKYPLTVAILKEMSQRGRDLLERAGAIVAEVPIIPKPTAPLGRGGRTPREDREKVFTKLNIWNMTQFDKLLFLDSDTLILRNVDELFDIELKEGEIAAAIYCSFHCDCEHVWNSGVMLLRPSSVTLANLITGFSQLTWGGQGDQSYLNAYFRHFGGHKAISHNYNMGKNTVRCKFEMWQPDKFSIFHFAGNDDTHPNKVSEEELRALDESSTDLVSLKELPPKKREKTALLLYQRKWREVLHEVEAELGVQLLKGI